MINIKIKRVTKSGRRVWGDAIGEGNKEVFVLGKEFVKLSNRYETPTHFSLYFWYVLNIHYECN